MNSYDSSDDHQPVTWYRGHPVFAAHLIVVAFVASMLVTTMVMRFNGHALLTWLMFTSESVFKGQVWRIFTYGFVNPPSFQFVADMFMIAWIGRELERFFGRRKFLILYGCLYFLTPLLFTLLGFWWSMSLAGETGALALFIAFATLYPGVPLIFGILAKWLALIFVAISTLIALAYHDDSGLISLWVTVTFAYAFVRYEQGHFSLPKFSLFRSRVPKTQLRVLPDPVTKRSAPASAEKETAMVEIDALLDKIARSGIASLTAKERAKLDAAAQLTKRKR